MVVTESGMILIKKNVFFLVFHVMPSSGTYQGLNTRVVFLWETRNQLLLPNLPEKDRFLRPGGRTTVQFMSSVFSNICSISCMLLRTLRISGSRRNRISKGDCAPEFANSKYQKSTLLWNWPSWNNMGQDPREASLHMLTFSVPGRHGNEPADSGSPHGANHCFHGEGISHHPRK